MAIIGSFIRTADGYTGTIRTLTLDRKVTVVSQLKDNDKAPDVRFHADGLEFGAGWKKTGQAGRDYLSCKLDDPTFPAPIYASLVASSEGEGLSLIWSR